MDVNKFPKETRLLQGALKQVRGMYWDKMYQMFYYKKLYYYVSASKVEGDITTFTVTSLVNKHYPYKHEYTFKFVKNMLAYDGFHDWTVKKLKRPLWGNGLNKYLDRPMPFAYSKYSKKSRYEKTKSTMTENQKKALYRRNTYKRKKREKYIKKYYENVTKRRRRSNAKPVKPVICTCVLCGEEFIAHRNSAKYCDNCKALSYNKLQEQLKQKDKSND